MYSSTAANALSLQLKAYYASLDSVTKLYVQDCLLEATSVKSVRNVQTWLTSGSTSRNMLNNRVGAKEYELRETAIRAILRLNNENVPMKTKTVTADRKVAAQVFGDYIKNKYTGKFTRSITFDALGFSISYDTYGSDDVFPKDIDDSDLIEFA